MGGEIVGDSDRLDTGGADDARAVEGERGCHGTVGVAAREDSCPERRGRGYVLVVDAPGESIDEFVDSG